MILLLLTTAFLLAVSATPIDEWKQYKAEHNKVYTSQVEDDRRLERYMKNKEMVEEHNRKYERGETTYTMGINQFSDWFPEEIDKMHGRKLDKNRPREGQKFKPPPGTPVPDSINWVEKGAVTKVKNQGKCLSDYAFAAAGALEGLMFRNNKSVIDLSAQQLVDCPLLSSCSAGLPEDCFRYVALSGGIDTDESYPYVAEKQICRAANGTIAQTCSGFTEVESERGLTSAVGTVGPVTIFFDVEDSFLHYKSGIYEGDCTNSLNSVLLAVGYGKDNVTNKDYWLLKNSWGTGWGEKGYARVLRNVKMCGMGILSTYPIKSK